VAAYMCILLCAHKFYELHAHVWFYETCFISNFFVKWLCAFYVCLKLVYLFVLYFSYWKLSRLRVIKMVMFGLNFETNDSKTRRLNNVLLFFIKKAALACIRVCIVSVVWEAFRIVFSFQLLLGKENYKVQSEAKLLWSLPKCHFKWLP